jgi:hypothetical protein
MTPPVDHWRTGDIDHTSQRWTLAEILAELLHLERRPSRIRLTETTTVTVTRTIEIDP